MIAQSPAVAARAAAFRASEVLERAARWHASVERAAAEGGATSGAVAERLRLRLEGVMAPLSEIAGALAGGLLDDASLNAVGGKLDALSAGLDRAELALRKLPVPAIRPEIGALLEDFGGSEGAPPVVLVPEDLDLDEDGFLALPIALGAAPLAWVRLAYGLAATRWPGQSPAAWDLQGARWLGPAYLFGMLGRRGNVHGDRIDRIKADLEGRSLFVPDARHALEVHAATRLLGGMSALAEAFPQAPDDSRAPGMDEPGFGVDDLVAAEGAADRLARGILPSARPTGDEETIRRGREALLAKPGQGLDAVYKVLEGLREEPLSPAQIVNGAWLHYERSRQDWVREALSTPNPVEAYGRKLRILEGLVLKSLDTSRVHHVLLHGRLDGLSLKVGSVTETGAGKQPKDRT